MLLTFALSHTSTKAPQVIELDDSSDEPLSNGSDDLDKIFNFDSVKNVKQVSTHSHQDSSILSRKGIGSEFPSSPVASSEPLKIAVHKKSNVCLSSQDDHLPDIHTRINRQMNAIDNIDNLGLKSDNDNDDDDLLILGENEIKKDNPILDTESSDISEISLSVATSSLNIGHNQQYGSKKRDSLNMNSCDISSISNITSSDDIVIEGLIDRPTKGEVKSNSPLRFNHSSTAELNRDYDSIKIGSQSVLENGKQSYNDAELQNMLNIARQNNPKLLKQVNKIKKTKEDLTAEMIASFDTSLLSSLKCVNPNFSKFLEPVGITTHLDPDTYPTIKFQRKVSAVYFSSAGVFVPVKPHIEYEGTLALFYDAKELPSLLEHNSLDKTLSYVSKKYRTSKIVIFLNGYSSYLQSITSKLNRQYVDKVRREISLQSQSEQNMDDNANVKPSQPDKKKRKKSRKAKAAEQINTLQFTAEQIRAQLLHYEFNYNVHMFPIKGLKDLVTWIKSFGYTLSSRHIDNGERNIEFAHIGTVKSGKDASSSFLEMIQQFKFITPATAKRFIKESKIDTIKKLYRAVNIDEPITGNSGRPLLRKNAYDPIRKVLRSDNEHDIV